MLNPESTSVDSSLSIGLNQEQTSSPLYTPDNQLQQNDSVGISADNTQLSLQGNLWRSLDLNYDVTSNTVIKFEYKHDTEGEIHGLLFDDNSRITYEDRSRTFQLAGTQNWGEHAAQKYSKGQTSDGFTAYEIPVGEYFTGDNFDLVFINDQDVRQPNASSQFRNIDISKDSADSDGVLIRAVNSVNGKAAETLAGQSASAEVSADQTQLSLTGNVWKSLDLNQEITSNSVIKFEYKQDQEGEIHGLLFDTDGVVSKEDRSRTFQLAGTQKWGEQAAQKYSKGKTSNGFTAYEIPVGQYLTGKNMDLVFINDHDVSNPTASSQFRNIQFTEQSTPDAPPPVASDPAPLPTPPAAPTPTPTPTPPPKRDSGAPSNEGIIMSRDFESGNLDGWYKELSESHSGRVVDDPLGSGNQVARFEYRFGDREAGGGRHAEIKQAPVSATGEYWYGFSTMVPKSWEKDDTWTILAQWHGLPDRAQGEPWRSPPLALEVKGDELRINTRTDSTRISSKKTSSKYVWRGDLDDIQGKWTDWAFRVNWSYKNDGFLEVYQDGNKIVDYKGPIGYNDARGPYFKVGVYQGNSPNKPTRVSYLDNFKFGDSRASLNSISPG